MANCMVCQSERNDLSVDSLDDLEATICTDCHRDYEKKTSAPDTGGFERFEDPGQKFDVLWAAKRARLTTRTRNARAARNARNAYKLLTAIRTHLSDYSDVDAEARQFKLAIDAYLGDYKTPTRKLW